MFGSGRGVIDRIPPVTKNIIILNLLIWLASITLPKVIWTNFGINFDLVELLGLHYFQASGFNPVQLVSYMFLHDTGSFAHVFFNMFSVYMFGRTIESTWGAKRFLTFYMVTGIGAGIIQELTWFLALGSSYTQIAMYGDQLNNLITIGASGAVFGILLAFGMLYPNTPLFLMFIPIPIKAKYFVIFYGVTELFLGVSRFSGDNIAHFAHLGGMLFGFFLIRYWKNKDKQNGRFFY
ncbi:MAG: rhomboid family intramembrane serine protease [Bacteroidales bacterium]